MCESEACKSEIKYKRKAGTPSACSHVFDLVFAAGPWTHITHMQ